MRAPPLLSPGPSSVADGFNINPGAHTGAGPYGLVPGAVGLPSSIWQQLGTQAPALPQLTQTATSTLGDEIAGRIPKADQDMIAQMAAQYGVNSGMPGSGFATNNLVRSLGLSSIDLTQKGLSGLNTLLGTVGSMQLSPELQAQIAEQNAVYAAAPDPQAAALQQIQTMKDLYQWEQENAPPVSGGSGTSPFKNISVEYPQQDRMGFYPH